MNDIDYIKTFKKRKLNLGDYLRLLMVIFSIVPILTAILTAKMEFKEKGEIDWGSLLFLSGFGIIVFYFARRFFIRSIYFSEKINDKSKDINLKRALSVLNDNLGVKHIINDDNVIIGDTNMTFSSFGEHITIVVDDNRILYNCWSKIGIWSMEASKIYNILDDKLNDFED